MCQLLKLGNNAALFAGVLIIVVVLSSICSNGIVISPNDEYDAKEISLKSSPEILALRDFDSKVHLVRTPDGYHLHVVRVINPHIRSRDLKRPVVFNHGLVESSTIWLVNSRHMKAKPLEGHNLCDPVRLDETKLQGPDLLSLPMALANLGYDVWLLSMRGTDWSHKHDMLNSTQGEFWNYSLDDFGLVDVPTVIDFVARETNAPKVGYVGHSQATFSVFALLSTRPEYADIIEPVVAVAPVSYIDHTQSLIKGMLLKLLEAKNRNRNGPFPKNPVEMRINFSNLCANKNNKFGSRFVCQIMEQWMAGKGRDWRRGYFSHIPYYSSLKVGRHFGQIIKYKRFSRYDYGPEKNLQIYGQAEVPHYPIEKIRSKSLVLVYSRTDNLSTVQDVQRFKKRLRVPLFKDMFIDQDKFNHMDMIIHEDCRHLINAPLIEVFEHFEHQTGVCSNTSNQRLDQDSLNNNNNNNIDDTQLEIENEILAS